MGKWPSVIIWVRFKLILGKIYLTLEDQSEPIYTTSEESIAYPLVNNLF